MSHTPNYNSFAYGSANPFPQGQCTWFAFGRALEVTGTTITFSQSYGRHGKTWLSLVTGLTTGLSPLANSVAVWAGDTSNPYGHVAFVESMSGDICSIRETNVKSFEKSFSKHCEESNIIKSYSTLSMKARGTGIGPIIGYIYLNPLISADFWRKSDPLNASPTASITNPNFDAQYKIKNVGSRIVTLEAIAIAVESASGQWLFDLAPKATPIVNRMIAPGDTVATGLCVGYFKTQGDFRVSAKVRIEGCWHTLDTLPFKVGPAIVTPSAIKPVLNKSAQTVKSAPAPLPKR